MVNVNIQGKIPLQGRGFIAKQSGGYQSGEYKNLTNLEIEADGVIRTRRNVETVGARAGATPPVYDKLFPFLGNQKSNLIVANATQQFAIDAKYSTAMWAPSSLPVPAATGSYHVIVGVFYYNQTRYWITHQFDASINPVSTYYIYYVADDPSASVGSYTFAQLSVKTLVSFNASTELKTFFIHKDRLWLVFASGVYYSKATDPTTFAVPDGGFFKIPDQDISYAFAQSDTVYVLTNSTVSILTYSADIGTDGYMRTLTTGLGGDWGCIHQGQPYFINKLGIYSINGLNVDKAYETQFDTAPNTFNQKLVSFQNYLIVLRRQKNYLDNVSEGTGAGYYKGYTYVFDKYGFNERAYNKEGSVASSPVYTNNNFNQWWINTETGSVHTFDFKDNIDLTEDSTVTPKIRHGYVSDVVFNPVPDPDGIYSLFLLVNRVVRSSSENTVANGGNNTGPVIKSNIYYVESTKRNAAALSGYADWVMKSTGAKEYYVPRFTMEIEAFTPDGNDYLLKKFRSCLVEGTFDYNFFQITFKFDGVAAYRTTKGIGDFMGTTPSMPPYSHRFGLNQRAKSMSVKIQSSSTLPSTRYDPTEIHDIRVLYSYLKRMDPRRSYPGASYPNPVPGGGG